MYNLSEEESDSSLPLSVVIKECTKLTGKNTFPAPHHFTDFILSPIGISKY